MWAGVPCLWCLNVGRAEALLRAPQGGSGATASASAARCVTGCVCAGVLITATGRLLCAGKKTRTGEQRGEEVGQAGVTETQNHKGDVLVEVGHGQSGRADGSMKEGIIGDEKTGCCPWLADWLAAPATLTPRLQLSYDFS